MKTLLEGPYRIEPGANYGTPKEVWGFDFDTRKKTPRTIARTFLRLHAPLFGLGPDLHGLSKKPKVIESLGAYHVIFPQTHRGVRIRRGYVTVHIRKHTGDVYLVKNRAVPPYLLPKVRWRDVSRAFKQRLSKKDWWKLVKMKRRTKEQLHKWQRKRAPKLLESERVWFPKGAEVLPAWRYRLDLQNPKERWDAFVHAETHEVLQKEDNVRYARHPRTMTGLVFDPSPVTSGVARKDLLRATRGTTRREDGPSIPKEAYRRVVLKNLDGEGFEDGHLDGSRVSINPGKDQKPLREHGKIFRWDDEGSYFEQVMAYYHLDNAITHLESLGFTDDLAIFKKPKKKRDRRLRNSGWLPLRVNVHGIKEDNSYYLPETGELVFGWNPEQKKVYGTPDVDDAEDAELILHEFGHAIQDAICPGFGQSKEAAAMGEGFGDYFAASFYAAKKPKKFQTAVQTWNGLREGPHLGSTHRGKWNPNCLRRVDEQLTYRDFRNKKDLQHVNGQIWSATLWDIRSALGRTVADKIILESHFQQGANTTFARGARAIIDADINLYRGRHVDTLRRIFEKREIGPVQ